MCISAFKTKICVQNGADLGLHLSCLLGIHGQDVLVVADGVLAVLILCADVPPQGLQDAVGLGGGRGEAVSRVRGAKHGFIKLLHCLVTLKMYRSTVSVGRSTGLMRG